jgi:single-stranded-DNA-specific exonuclease
MSEAQFLQQLTKSVAEFRRLLDRPWVLIHHNDADGISSGSILGRMFERLGLRVQRYVLEKPYPEAVAKIFSLAEDAPYCFMFADFASGMLQTLVELNTQHSPLFILDHHSIQAQAPLASMGECLQLVNPRQFAVSGDTAASAATVCALFAHEVSPYNADLAVLGIVGAAGDKQFEPVGLAPKLPGALHARVLEVAQQSQQLQLTAAEWLLRSRTNTGSIVEISVTELVQALDALGSFGYYAQGVDLALKGLAEGFGASYRTHASALRHDWLTRCEAFFAREQLQQQPGFLCFELDQSFQQMGVKTVGLCAEWLLSSGRCAPQYTLIGLQRLRSDIPGLGITVKECYKVSARVGAVKAAAIDRGHAFPLSRSLSAAAQEVGGFVDACHARAAACTIPFEARAAFLQAFSRNLQTARD